jgi:SAM-dependent methyltransferase
MTDGTRTRGAGGVDWRDVWARMRSEADRQTSVRADPRFVMPDDPWAPRAERFARRSADGGPDAVADWLRAKVRPDDSVLDVGAGTGRYVRVLSPLASRVVAVEPSAAMRGQLEVLVAGAALGNVEVVGEAWPPAKPRRADVVLCAHVVYGIEDIAAFVEALDRAAGRLCAIVCGMRPPNAVLAPVWEAVHGEPRRPMPGAVELFNLLHQIGIPASLQVLPRANDAFRYHDGEDALRALRHRLHLTATPENDERIRRAIETKFARDAGGSRSIRPVPDDAMLWWTRRSGPSS